MKKTSHEVPKTGSSFRHRYKGTLYIMTVVSSGDGVGYEVLGTVYRSPTAAAKSIVGKDTPTNGRAFWSMDKELRSSRPNA
jgi:hypothetical protein